VKSLSSIGFGIVLYAGVSVILGGVPNIKAGLTISDES
jgi:hypothetical protein